MASQSLYRKWRSQTFADMVGQEPVIRTLKNALKSNSLAHAYLFTGPRGTGKTSTARLLAKTINCLNAKDGEPCNECLQCREITAGNSFNVIEIDAASNRGIDSIRELREKVMMPPSTGKYKVYILDEAHMLTTEAFNALLKTLEEPPPHAIFVMATTDVHKMLPTVLSRCQRFDFKRFTIRQIVDHLNFITSQEDVTLERGTAELMARAAAGGMRDALSLLDQAIAYSGQVVTLAQVQAMLGVADPRAIQRFITAIAQLDSPGGLHLIHELAEDGADLRQINVQIAEYWRAMMLARAGANITAILEHTEDELREITQTAHLFNLEELIECARIFAQNELMQKSQGTPQLGLELAFLACIELHRRAQSGKSVAATSQPVSQARIQEPSSAMALPPAPIVAREEERPQPPRLSLVPPQPIKPIPTSKASEEPTSDLADRDSTSFTDDEFELVSGHQEAPIGAAQAHNVITSASPAAEASSTNDASLLTVQQVKEKWEYVKRRVRTKKDGAKIAAVLNGYTVVGVEQAAGLPVVLIKANASFHYTSLQKSEYSESIEWAMKVELNQECRVRLLPPGQTGSSIHIPSPVVQDTGTRSTNASTVSPQPMIRREPSLSDNPPSALHRQSNQIAVRSEKQEPSASTKSHISPSLPLVKTNDSASVSSTLITRENGVTPQERVKKKAMGDPVVRKAVEMFKAEIKDIYLK